MRFANLALLAAAVAADEKKVEWLPSADATAEFKSDNADETASVTWKTLMKDDAMTVSGSTTISSKAKQLNQMRWVIGLRKAATDTACFQKDVFYTSANVAADEAWASTAYSTRAAAANQLACNDANGLQQGLQKGNLNDGYFNQKDPDYMSVSSAKRTQKNGGGKPAIATAEWTRPVAESPEKAWAVLPEDTEFQAALAW